MISFVEQYSSIHFIQFIRSIHASFTFVQALHLFNYADLLLRKTQIVRPIRLVRIFKTLNSILCHPTHSKCTYSTLSYSTRTKFTFEQKWQVKFLKFIQSTSGQILEHEKWRKSFWAAAKVASTQILEQVSHQEITKCSICGDVQKNKSLSAIIYAQSFRKSYFASPNQFGEPEYLWLNEGKRIMSKFSGSRR